MSYRDLIYWRKGFNFSRSTHGDRVAVEVYRLLYHYTWENPNCRAGTIIDQVGVLDSFHTIHKLIPEFDRFEKKALFQDDYINHDNDFMRDLMGHSFYDEIENFQRLRCPLRLEFHPKSFLSSLFGYNFDNCLGIIIKPEDIMKVEGSSLDNFVIQIKDYEIQVVFRTVITIR